MKQDFILLEKRRLPQADKAKRAAAVLSAQTSPNAGARGVDDLSASPKTDAKIEKESLKEEK